MIIFKDDGSPNERHTPENHRNDNDRIDAGFFKKTAFHQCLKFQLKPGKDKKGWIDTSPLYYVRVVRP